MFRTVTVLRSLLALAAVSYCFNTRASALEVEFTSRTVVRDVLALYDARYEGQPATTRIHRLAEMPLNWLGYKLTYRDVNAPLPPREELSRYRAVLSWLVEPLASPETYVAWLDGATAAGLRLLCLSEPVPSDKSLDKGALQRVLERIGLKDTDQFVNVTMGSKPLTMDPEMVGFERPLDRVIPPFPVYQPASSATRVHLSLSVPAGSETPSSALVVTAPGGGYVADAFTIFYEANADRARWIVNPFLFFKKALGEERFPVPDVTTLAGRRMYFSQIDGDGWNNISEIDGYRQDQVTAAEVVRKELIEPYPDLPVSVGLIAGDADEELGGTRAAAQTAAHLFALSQVEVASHTYTHPFAWGFYEKYDREAEMRLIEAASHPDVSLMDRVRGFLYRVAGKSEISEARSKYIAGGAGLPRGYLKEPFDIEKEVKGALQVSESLAPRGKKAALYLWSGDTEPFEAAIRATREAGVRNLNGGDTRLDDEYPSVFYVPPIARPVGAERQIYAANSNENTYTNNWTGPFWGQKLLVETLKNTESPRRLKPFNLYYHMYSGEKPGAMSALKDILELARSSAVVPVKASTYAGVADDFFQVEIAQIDALSWTISKRATLQTFRFDDATGLSVDVDRSRGVLGYTVMNGALYVALDPVVEPAVLALSKSTDGQKSVYDAALLIDSRWQVQGLTRGAGCGFRFRAEGFGTGEMKWRVRPLQKFSLKVSRGDAGLPDETVTSDAAGILTLGIKADALTPLHVELVCHDA